MPESKILVCTPTLHRFVRGQRVDNLRRNIESVARQSYSNLIHVVVKPRCSAGAACESCRETEALVSGYQQQDPRLIYVALAERGDRFGYFGRNHAIRNFASDLIAYLDDDNWWEVNHLASLHAALREQAAAFAFSASYVRSSRGRLLLRRATSRPYFTGIDVNELLHRRELLDKYGAWNLSYNADWEMVRTWLQHGERYAATRLFTSNYTLKPGLRAEALYFYTYFKHRIPQLLPYRNS